MRFMIFIRILSAIAYDEFLAIVILAYNYFIIMPVYFNFRFFIVKHLLFLLPLASYYY